MRGVLFYDSPVFFQLLRKGIMVDVGKGVDVKSLLCEKLKIQEEYIDHEVQTVFLNGRWMI